MSTLFAVFDNEEVAISSFEKYTRNHSFRGYGCFSPYFDIYDPEFPFHLGSKFMRYGKEFERQFNDAFKNISVTHVHEFQFPMLSFYRVNETGEAGPFIVRDLENTRRSLRNFRISSFGQRSKKATPFNIVVNGIDHTQYYHLFRIYVSEKYSKNARLILGKLVAIMIRVLSPGFNYISQSTADSYHENLLELVVEANNEAKGGTYLALSGNQHLTVDNLLAMDDIKVVNSAERGQTYQYGWQISQTSSLERIAKRAGLK